MKLLNKVAVITGGSSGIGKAIVEEFKKEGAKVIVVDRNSHPDTLTIAADLSKKEDIQKIIDESISKYGKVDILVNCAGVYERNLFLESTHEIWDKTMDINLRSIFFLCKGFIKHMKENNSGNIINISSNAGFMTKNKKGIEYGLSKSGVIYLTKSLAISFVPTIRVNCISPGYTLSKMNKFIDDPILQKEIEESIPMKRLNQPKDIAKLTLFLASEDSRNITGQNITIDGGMCLK
jgi:NAD(P)-dependent dehydrogenase (short-subunit alcohol dehydrogenase family)